MEFDVAPQDVRVRYLDREWEGRLSSRGATEGVLETPLSTTIGSLLVCRVEALGDRPDWLTLEVAVVRVMAPPSAGDGWSSYLVRWRWAFARVGVQVLAERVQRLTGLASESLDERLVGVLEDGALYAFDERALRFAENAVRKAHSELGGPRIGSRRAHRGGAPVFGTTLRIHEPFIRIRAHRRAQVDLPCRYIHDGKESAGFLRDISREGAFISTRWKMPAVDDRITVTVNLSVDGHRRSVVLTGSVRWATEEWRPERPPGFGVRVESVVDGQKGKIFHRYLDLLLGEDAETVMAEEPDEQG